MRGAFGYGVIATGPDGASTSGVEHITRHVRLLSPTRHGLVSERRREDDVESVEEPFAKILDPTEGQGVAQARPPGEREALPRGADP
jgi:hypothetical protein